MAEERWPEFPRLVLDMATRYPVLPPLPSGRITNLDQLPADVRREVSNAMREKGKGKFLPKMGKKAQIVARIRQSKGQWPEFARAVTDLLRLTHKNLKPLGASRPKEFPRKIQAFLDEQLFPALDDGQQASLKRLEGRWPDYPLRLHELARLKNKPIPEMSLPGSRSCGTSCGVPWATTPTTECCILP